MKSIRQLWTVVVLGLLSFFLTCNARAQLSAGPNDVQVVYALYGSRDSYVNVTEQVTQLLQGGNFFAHSDVLHANPTSANYNSLIILYNFDESSHLFVRRDNAGEINSELLEDEAKLDGRHGHPFEVTNPLADDFQIFFVLYGVHATFLDVTDIATKALRDSPDDFVPGNAVFGGDPEDGSSKSIIFIYDYLGKRHIYATLENGTKVSAATLKAMAQVGGMQK